jgi:hypothetical protein
VKRGAEEAREETVAEVRRDGETDSGRSADVPGLSNAVHLDFILS